MPLPFPVNIAAECLRAGCSILGDKRKKIGGTRIIAEGVVGGEGDACV
jgi:hypothetical protein